MIVVAHRPPLKRIEIGQKPRPPVPDTELPTLKALRELGERIENERIWRCVERASQGQGSKGNDSAEIPQD